MFGWPFFSNSSQKKSENVEEKQNNFTTQNDILNKIGKPDAAGICLGTTNLYTKEQMGLKPKNSALSGSPNEIYERAIAERNEAISKIYQGKKPALNAFNEAKVKFSEQLIPTFLLTHPSFCKRLVENKANVIIEVPTKSRNALGNRNTHLVGVGQDRVNPSKCYFFDANQEGGAYVDNCDEVYKQMASRLNRHYIKQISLAHVASVDSPRVS